MDFEKSLHQRRVVEYLSSEFGNTPEVLGGLFSIVESVEDYTCFTAKKMLGRRDKAWGV
ncbi:MAG: hypothetical protein ACK4SY_08500 [Pyrobaculum sp.]